MTLTQGLTAIIVFWAIIGGLGASLLLPAMQSLIHGNFEGTAQKQVYALVGAAAAIAAAVGPAARWVHHDLPVVAGRRSGSRSSSSRSCCPASGWSATCPTPGRVSVDVVGAVLSVRRHGRNRARHPGLAGGRRSGRRAASSSGAAALARLGVVVAAAQARGEGRCCWTRTCSARSCSGSASPGRLLQQIALGGTMIALPIYLQMVLEYNAMQAGLSLAPLSLSMFGMALLAGKNAGRRRPATVIRIGFVLLTIGLAALVPLVPRADVGMVAGGPAAGRWVGARPARVAAEQLHAVAGVRGAGERGGGGQLGGRLVRALVRARFRRGHHARDAVPRLHAHGRQQRRPHRRAAATGRHRPSSTTPRS